VPVLDLVDDTWVARAPEVVADAVHDRARWTRWWPGLRLTVTRDRGVKGVQWVAQPADDLPARGRRGRPVRWVGTLELWLEPWGAGTVVHHYQRLDPQGTVLAARQVDRLRAARARAWKHAVHALKDELEACDGTVAGHADVPAPVKAGPARADNQGR
jgi:hypothetical protein